ncbi:MAG: hypothetical protein KA346_06210 [Neisseriaceae bacterium]|nr:hypothetical protein [Neisseriaceae bacterium]
MAAINFKEFFVITQIINGLTFQNSSTKQQLNKPSKNKQLKTLYYKLSVTNTGHADHKYKQAAAKPRPVSLRHCGHETAQ